MTAEKFLEDYLNTNSLPWSPEMEKQIGCVHTAMISFATYHTQQAIEAICEKSEMADVDRPIDFFHEDGNQISKILNQNIYACEGYYHIALDKESVKNAYDLSLIK